MDAHYRGPRHCNLFSIGGVLDAAFSLSQHAVWSTALGLKRSCLQSSTLAMLRATLGGVPGCYTPTGSTLEHVKSAGPCLRTLLKTPLSSNRVQINKKIHVENKTVLFLWGQKLNFVYLISTRYGKRNEYTSDELFADPMTH